MLKQAKDTIQWNWGGRICKWFKTFSTQALTNMQFRQNDVMENLQIILDRKWTRFTFLNRARGAWNMKEIDSALFDTVRGPWMLIWYVDHECFVLSSTGRHIPGLVKTVFKSS